MTSVPSSFSLGQNWPSETVHYAILPAYPAPGRPHPDDVWQQAKAAGVLGHMEPSDIENYAYAFTDVRDLAERTETERNLSAQLSFLSYDLALSSTDRVHALSTIARLDRLNRDEMRSAESLIGYAKSLAVRFSPAQNKEFQEYLDIGRRCRGTCVDPAAAAKAVAPLRPGAGR